MIHRQSLFTILGVSNKSNYRNLLSVCKIMPAMDIVKKTKICYINDLVNIKKEGLCYETQEAEFNEDEIITLRDEVSSYCSYFDIPDVNVLYQNPVELKKMIWRGSMSKLWKSLLNSKKAPYHPRNLEEKSKFYFSLPRHMARLALGHDTGELNFRANRRNESILTSLTSRGSRSSRPPSLISTLNFGARGTQIKESNPTPSGIEEVSVPLAPRGEVCLTSTHRRHSQPDIIQTKPM